MPFGATNYKPIPEGHRRLLVLAEFLETRVPPERLRMQGWSNARNSLRDECGTSACAAGWDDVIPEFRAAGYSCRLSGPLFGGFDGYTALGMFFDIERKTVDDLFGPYSYAVPTIPHVVARIRAFVAEQAKVAP